MEFETKLYNPAAQPEEWLIEHFVVRTKVFERLFEDIRSGTMEHPEQHYLIQGQRGMGKTTLLLRLKYEIEKTDELKDWLMPVFFNEESYDLTSLSSLWEKLLKYFDTHFSDGGGYYNATDKFIGSDDYEQKCYDLVVDILRNHKKKLVILFDNFGELFLDNLNERDSHRFREILMTSADIRIVAASSVVLESQNDYSEPFFDFFKIINLQGLNKDETFELIVKLQERSTQKIDIEGNRARIETLSVLTGGVIRTIIMLYEILLNDMDGSAIKDLEKILDAVTPLYKHRMEDLKPQQRRIVDVVAKNWDAISVKEISNSIRENGKPIASKIVSAQLQELEKNNLVEKIKTSTKNNFYLVKERFFNIWYLMRHGDKTTQCKVKWLTRFLEMWYSNEREGMNSYIKEYIGKLESGKYISSSAITISNALLASENIDLVNKALVIDATEKVVTKNDLRSLPQIDKEKLNEAIKRFTEEKYAECLAILKQITPATVKVIELIGMAHFMLEEFKESKYYLSQVSDNIDNSDVDLATGLSYYFLSENDKALHYLLRAMSKGNAAASAIGKIYFKKGEYNLAEEFFLKSPDLNSDIELLFMLGNIYLNHNVNGEKAEEYQRKILDRDPQNLFAWVNIAHAYIIQERSTEEIESVLRNVLSLTKDKNIMAMVSNVLMIFYVNRRINKKEALALAETKVTIEFRNDIYKSFVFVWNDKFKEGLDLVLDKVDKIESESISALNNLLLLILSKKQLHAALRIFNENSVNLKERLKPTYYALMYLLKNEYPDEFLKMGKELQEPVKDILAEIEQFAIDYA